MTSIIDIEDKNQTLTRLVHLKESPLPIYVALLLATLTGCNRLKQSDASSLGASVKAGEVQNQSQTVSVSLPEKTRYRPEIQVTGIIKPIQSAELSMPLAGTVTAVLVSRGQKVKSGAPLAVLDASAAKASLAQAEASILAANAQLALGEDALERQTVMREHGAATENQFVQAKGQRELASAQLKVANAQREQAKVLLRKHTLVAPFAGVIVRAPNGSGMTVGPQSPLFVIEDIDSLILETSVTQEEAAELTPKSKVRVTVPATGIVVEDAILKLILPSVDATNNRVPIEVLVPNSDRRVLSHAFVRAVLPSAGEREVYRVHQGALSQQNGSFSVWMATPEGKATSVRVRLFGQTENEFAVVDPGPEGFPKSARVINTPPLGIVVGQTLNVGF
jgi:membrane fusion protein, multidrug efflux system